MAIKRDHGIVVKKANKSIMEKYKANIGQKEEFLEFAIRGEKPRKIAEYAEAIKYLSVHEPTLCFKIPQAEFVTAYGSGKKGENYVKMYLKKFGIPQPRVLTSKEVVNLWSKSPVK